MKKLTLALAGAVLAAICALPVQAKDTSGPVTCTDGTTSPHGGRGACSKHGGIKKDAAPAKADAAAPAAPAAAAVPAKPAVAPAAAAAAPAKPAAAASAAAAAPAAPAAAPAAPAKPAAAATPAATATGGKSVNADPTGATAKCKDGSYSHSKTHKGACSRHGGVADWLDGATK